MGELLKDFENADTISIDTLALDETLHDEWVRDIDELHKLSKKVCCLHTNMLYYRQPKTNISAICFDVWKTLVKRVGGTFECWRELGVHLGIPQDDLDYIGHSMKDDPTDIVLKVFIQSEDATLDKVVDGLVKMERYDILKTIENPLNQLAQCFHKEETKSDTGYHSGSKHSQTRQIFSLSNVPNDLPPALRAKNLVTPFENEPRKPRQPEKLQATTVERTMKNDSPVLLLTYAEDGHETALNLQNRVNSWPEDFPTVSILSLNDKKDSVLQNPETFIREYFEKADYVVPILTSGYLNAIKQHAPNIPNTTDNLDYKYTHFIYTLIVNNYIHFTGCLNKKVRSVLPLNVHPNVVMEIGLYPDLMPYTNEEVFDETFQAFLMDPQCDSIDDDYYF